MAALSLLALQAWPGAAQYWRFDRVRYEQGAYYLLLSGQFVHLGWAHAGANAFAFGALVAWLVRTSGLRAVVVTTVAAVAGVAVVLAIDGNCRFYAGASGWLHGLLAAGLWLRVLAANAIKQGATAQKYGVVERRWAIAAMWALFIKLGLEAWGLWPQGWAFPVYTPAHLAGVVGASVGVWLWWLIAQKR